MTRPLTPWGRGVHVLVLLSFALVLLATVLLVLGLLNDDGLTLIYASIGASVLAAVVLIVALRRNKPQEVRAEAPTPLPADEPEDAPVAPSPVAAPAAPVAAAVDGEPDGEWLASEHDWEGEEVDFPIADYDDLTPGQIL